MKCMSCGADIPPEWVHSIQTNSCPGCGGEIMSEPTQELLRELTEAMDRMPNDPQGVAGWLLSNYRFQKFGSAEPVDKFHRKGGVQIGDVDENNLKIAENNGFFERSDAAGLVARGEELKMKKSGKMAELASIIKQAGDPYGDDNPEPKEVDNNEDDEKAYIEMKASGLDPFAQGGMTDIPQGISTGDISEFLSKQKETPGHEDVLSQSIEGKKLLQRENFKKIKAQSAISGGGGAFRR